MNETRLTPQDWADLPDGAEGEMRKEAIEADGIAILVQSNKELMTVIAGLDADKPEALEEILIQAIAEFGAEKSATDPLGVVLSLQKIGVLSVERVDKFGDYWDADITLLRSKEEVGAI